MYKGYKTYRHFLNAKLHALAVQIAGEEHYKEFLESEVTKLINRRITVGDNSFSTSDNSVIDLAEVEAEWLYKEMVKICRTVKDNVKTSKILTGSDDSITPGQRKAIIKLTKYNFRWSPEATFSFILGIVPEKRKRMSAWEIQNSKLLKLFSILSKKDADRIIKRLDKIKQRNNG